MSDPRTDLSGDQPPETAGQDPTVVRPGGELDDPAEGARETDDGSRTETSQVPSTHVPDTRAFDL